MSWSTAAVAATVFPRSLLSTSAAVFGASSVVPYCWSTGRVVVEGDGLAELLEGQEVLALLHPVRDGSRCQAHRRGPLLDHVGVGVGEEARWPALLPGWYWPCRKKMSLPVVKAFACMRSPRRSATGPSWIRTADRSTPSPRSIERRTPPSSGEPAPPRPSGRRRRRPVERPALRTDAVRHAAGDGAPPHAGRRAVSRRPRPRRARTRRGDASAVRRHDRPRARQGRWSARR